MRILLTGGGTGGHFYPIIAVAQEINAITTENKLADVELFYMSPTPYNEGELFNNKIIYKKNYAGKMRRYFSILNFFDLFKTGWGVIRSLWEYFSFTRMSYSARVDTLAFRRSLPHECLEFRLSFMSRTLPPVE